MRLKVLHRSRISTACGFAISGLWPILAAAQVSNESGAALEEVVVTAQKRTEVARDVPSSISVLSGRQLADMDAVQLSDYAAYVPGFNIDSAGTPGQTTITLRGVAPLGPGAAVGTYIDEAPLGSSANFAEAGQFALDLLPYDIERIEVLRGPQGTLYGASTMGGLVKYVMRSPSLDRFSAQLGGEMFGVKGSGASGWGARASWNVPIISDELAVSASYFNQHTPGYIDNGLTGLRDENPVVQQGGRVALLFQPNSQVTVKVSALLQHIDADNDAVMSLNPITLAPLAGDLGDEHYVSQPFRQRLQFYLATVNWNIDWADFVSATSYARTQTDRIQDTTLSFGPLIPFFTGGAVSAGVTPFMTDLSFRKFTQELRLASATGQRMEWLLGAFYTDENSGNFQEVRALDPSGVPIAGLDPLVASPQPTTYREYALFGDLTYKITGGFDVTGGLRWAHNRQQFSEADVGPLVGNTLSSSNNSSEHVLTYMVSPRLHINSDTMAYIRVASGYRPGGPNFGLPGIPPTVHSDRLVNYEVGIKATLLDSHLETDLAIFYINWNHIQIAVPFSGNSAINYLANGGSAQSRGVEWSANYSPMKGLRFGVNTAYTSATLTEDVPALNGLSGARLPLVPTWSGALTADYGRTLAGTWTGTVGLAYRYTGDRYSLISSDPQAIKSDEYKIMDLNANVANAHWTVRLYAKNVFDKRAYLTPSLISDAFGTPVQVNTSIAQPRTVGLGVDYRF
jgi:iron complex outermembrane recepter protein